MFLTRGEIHQEPLWALWFQHLAGLVPVSALRVSQHAVMTAMPGVLCQRMYLVLRAHHDMIISNGIGTFVERLLGMLQLDILNALFLSSRLSPDSSCSHLVLWIGMSMPSEICADT